LSSELPLLRKGAGVPIRDSNISRNSASGDRGITGQSRWRIIADVAVAAVLVVALSIAYVFDRQVSPVVVKPPPAVVPPSDPEPEPEPPPEPPPIELPEEILPPIDPVRRIMVQYSPDTRFGVSTTTGSPDDSRDDNKKLTYSTNGSTNNTRLWVDGATPLFGSSVGRLLRPVSETSNDRTECAWEYNAIHVIQTVEYIAGDNSRRIDSVRVDYQLENAGTMERTVGLRVMLDSFIGENDGVPFIVPGREQIVTTPQSFRGEAVPDFIRALEYPNLVAPGVIADLRLRSEGERPVEVTLTHWPGTGAEWDYNRTAAFGSDTAIGLYYEPKPLPPGRQRLISFIYGLGTITSTQTKNAKLSLTAGGPFRAGGRFWLVALVQYPQPVQQVRLDLPSGLTFDPAHPASKPVPAGTDYTQVSWLVEIAPTTFGPAELKVTLDPGSVEERCRLVIEPRNARLTLVAKEPARSGRPFWVSALVQHAKAGQTVELKLSGGLAFAKGHGSGKPVPQGGSISQINWLIDVPARVSGDVVIAARLKPDGIDESTTVNVQASSLID
jgi:hypothetical protein